MLKTLCVSVFWLLALFQLEVIKERLTQFVG